MGRSQWEDLIEQRPEHTQWFIDKFERAAAEGRDIVREARFVDALVPRQARVLDAGCGSGRHAAHLAACGHTVVGVDVDPGLVEHARAAIPGATFVCANLDSFELPSEAPSAFDAILLAGNVVTFFHPDTRVPILRRLRGLLAPEGRIAVGFGVGRGYPFGEFRDDVRRAELSIDYEFSTWDLRPVTVASEFLVTVLSAGSRANLPLARVVRRS